MKNWVVGLISAGATGLVAIAAGWFLGTFEKGMRAAETETIRTVIQQEVLSENEIKIILDEKMRTADGKTYGQVLVATKEELIELKTEVRTMKEALRAITGAE